MVCAPLKDSLKMGFGDFSDLFRDLLETTWLLAPRLPLPRSTEPQSCHIPCTFHSQARALPSHILAWRYWPHFAARQQNKRIDSCACIQSRFLGRGCDEALFSEKKGVLSEKGGGNSVNQAFGRDFHRKGNSVKRSGRFSEPPDSEN